MKVGMRKPSLKKSFSARTTGKVNRALKKSVNPLYGKKGTGFLRDPERAIKNKIYRETTFSASEMRGAISGRSKPRRPLRVFLWILGILFVIFVIALFL